MESNKRKLYFAYGSNCNLSQMAYRCPDARVIGPVTLNNYRLTFNGKRNGTGVANIRRRNGAVVHGVLWEITERCERSLDGYEGFPHLYEKKTVTVHAEDGKAQKAMAYVMTPGHKEPAVPPTYYLIGIAQGFTQNGIDPRPVYEAAAEVEKLCGERSRV